MSSGVLLQSLVEGVNRTLVQTVSSVCYNKQVSCFKDRCFKHRGESIMVWACLRAAGLWDATAH